MWTAARITPDSASPEAHSDRKRVRPKLQRIIPRNLSMDVNSIRSQRGDAFHNGFLQGSENPPSDWAQQVGEAEAYVDQ